MRPVFTYPTPDGETTVEKLLLSHGYSRRLIIALKKIPDGLCIGGLPACVTRRMEPGEVLTVQLPEEYPAEKLVPVKMPLNIVYEDSHILVVNKASGVPVHPSQGNFSNSLANGIAWYFAEQNCPIVFRAVNRLDKDTTGLLLLAKHALSACILSDMVTTRQIHRTYLAAVRGNMSSYAGDWCTVSAPIGRAEGSILERQVDFDHGEAALTRFRFLCHRPDLDISLVELELETGRTHQIRVHMKYLGFPLLGDFLYNPDYRYIDRQSLHSRKLSFLHPITKEPLSFTAAVPDDMQIFLHESVQL